MLLQEHNFAMKGECVMVTYFMYSALDYKCHTLNKILYSIPKVRDLLAAFLFLFHLLLNTISGLHIKLNAGYLGEYKKHWLRCKTKSWSG